MVREWLKKLVKECLHEVADETKKWVQISVVEDPKKEQEVINPEPYPYPQWVSVIEMAAMGFPYQTTRSHLALRATNGLDKFTAKKHGRMVINVEEYKKWCENNPRLRNKRRKKKKEKSDG